MNLKMIQNQIQRKMGPDHATTGIYYIYIIYYIIFGFTCWTLITARCGPREERASIPSSSQVCLAYFFGVLLVRLAHRAPRRNDGGFGGAVVVRTDRGWDRGWVSRSPVEE